MTYEQAHETLKAACKAQEHCFCIVWTDHNGGYTGKRTTYWKVHIDMQEFTATTLAGAVASALAFLGEAANPEQAGALLAGVA